MSEREDVVSESVSEEAGSVAPGVRVDGRRGGWRFRVVVAVLVCVVAAVVVVVMFGKGDVPKNFGVVEEGVLYRAGTLTPATMRYAVEELGVKRIVDFGGTELGSDEFRAVYDEAEELGVTVLRLGMHGDGRGDPNNYVRALKVMETAREGDPVLVHCAAGAERTGVCVVLYRTLIQDWDVERAYVESMEYGHSAGDNWRFLAYLAEWKDDIERSYREGGLIGGHGFEDKGPGIRGVLGDDQATGEGEAVEWLEEESR